MIFTDVKIENFKGLKCCETKVDEFTCVIGKNNAGKSSFLMALMLFITGSRLDSGDYFEPDQDIIITVTLSDITEVDLQKIAEHRDRIEPYIKGNQLKIARRYSPDGKSNFRLFNMIPVGDRFTNDSIKTAFSEKRGDEISETLRAEYPEIELSEEVTTQRRAKELIQDFIDDLDDAYKVEVEADLPPGFDNSIKKLLPEPIYIPAVKDLSDDMSTKSSASFGKLLNILLSEIEEEFAEADEVFANLKKKLNRIVDEEYEVDDRIEKVKLVEATIQSNLNETFLVT
jgi:putative ATP-dependent endonuclease of the OLD family